MMYFSTFYNEACKSCGTQRCPATEEAAETCCMWKKVKDAPDKEAYEIINKYYKEVAIENPILSKIKIEYELTSEEFKNFIEAFNNGLYLANRTYAAMRLGAEVPLEFDKMIDRYSSEELEDMIHKRLNSLYKFYSYLEDLK